MQAHRLAGHDAQLQALPAHRAESFCAAWRAIEEHRHARRPTHSVQARECRYRPACLHARRDQRHPRRSLRGLARTVDNWIAAIPEFGDAVRQGRQVADESVVSALFARATGMERKVTKAFCHKGQPITVSYTVELPPDVRACMFWLRNRRPRQWRENRPLIDERDDLDFRGLEEASQRAALADRDKSPEAAPVRGGPDALPPPSPPLNIVVSSVPPLRNCPLFHCLTFGVHYIRPPHEAPPEWRAHRR
jgi:hypothetical protein